MAEHIGVFSDTECKAEESFAAAAAADGPSDVHHAMEPEGQDSNDRFENDEPGEIFFGGHDYSTPPGRSELQHSAQSATVAARDFFHGSEWQSFVQNKGSSCTAEEAWRICEHGAKLLLAQNAVFSH